MARYGANSGSPQFRQNSYEVYTSALPAQNLELGWEQTAAESMILLPGVYTREASPFVALLRAGAVAWQGLWVPESEQESWLG